MKTIGKDIAAHRFCKKKDKYFSYFVQCRFFQNAQLFPGKKIKKKHYFSYTTTYEKVITVTHILTTLMSQVTENI